MISLVQASLLLAMAPVGPPPTELVILEPKSSLQNIQRFVDWAALARPDLAPDRLRDAARDLEIDPFDLKTLESHGARVDKPIRLWLDGGNRCMLAEVPLAAPKKARARLKELGDRAVEKGGVERLGDTALLFDSGGPWAVAAVVDGNRLLLQIPEPQGLSFFSAPGERRDAAAPKKQVRHWSEHSNLIPLVPLKSKSRPPAAFPVPGHGPPDVVFATRAAPDLPPSRGQAWFTKDGIEVRARARLSLQAETAASELVPRQGGARRLIDASKHAPVVDMVAELAPAGTALLAERMGLPKAASALLLGPVQAVLTESGDVLVAFAVRAQTKLDLARAVREAVAMRYPAARTLLRTGSSSDRLVVWMGAMNEKAIESMLVAKPEAVLPSFFHIDAEPSRAPAAFEARSRAADGLGLPTVQLMFFRLVLRPLLLGTGTVEVDVWPKKGEAELSAKVAYQTRGVP